MTTYSLNETVWLASQHIANGTEYHKEIVVGDELVIIQVIDYGIRSETHYRVRQVNDNRLRAAGGKAVVSESCISAEPPDFDQEIARLFNLKNKKHCPTCTCDSED